jgi:hypothetical protein
LKLLLRTSEQSLGTFKQNSAPLNIEVHGTEKYFYMLVFVVLFAFDRQSLILILYVQIVIVAVMCKPHRCPHINMTGNICVYCPGGPDSDFEYSTQSYTGYEPTSMRAIRARYNPYLQTRHRIEQVCLYNVCGQQMHL